MIAPQRIHLEGTYQCLYLLRVWIIHCDRCVGFSSSQTILQEIYQYVYICVSYMLKYQWSDFMCMNSKHQTNSKEPVVTSLPEVYQYVCRCVSYVRAYQCLFYLRGVWIKASLKQGCVWKCICIITWKISYCSSMYLWQHIWK